MGIQMTLNKGRVPDGVGVVVGALRSALGANEMMAYLVEMAVRLVELRRVLKAGGVLSVMETLTDCDYQLEASVRDLCRAHGFDEINHERRRLGYTLCFSAPGAA